MPTCVAGPALSLAMLGHTGGVTLTSIRPPALSALEFRKSFASQRVAVNRESDTAQQFQDISDVFKIACLKA